MQIKVLELGLYVEKFYRRPSPGCRYLTEDRVIYRLQSGESEDIGELPAGLDAVELPAIHLEGGEYVGDSEAISRLRRLSRDIRILIEEYESVRRS